MQQDQAGDPRGGLLMRQDQAGAPAEYRVCYWCGAQGADAALIVEDAQGVAYLFSGGVLQCRLGGAQAVERLRQWLDAPGQWAPIPSVTLSTLDGLRRLTAPTAAPVPRAADA